MMTEPKKNPAALAMLEFISRSPSCFHAVSNICAMLRKEGFEELAENEHWNLLPGKRYYTTRNGSSVISWTVPCEPFKGFSLVASHSDSPSFKIKENCGMQAEKHYVKLNVEKYGGMICSSWLDRPLSVAGRLLCRKKTESGIVLESRLVNVDRDLLLIPNLAIHMNREINDGYKFNAQNDMLPVFCMGKADNVSFVNTIAESEGIDPVTVVCSDLYLYNRVLPTFWGKDNEFIASARLDDLECAFTTLRGFLDSVKKGEFGGNMPVHCVFDNEEVGSQTRQGAAGTFLSDTLRRIALACKKTGEDYYIALSESFMVSADNAHAVHPNYPDKADPTNRPFVNGGPVIKFNAAQKYTSDAISAAVFESVCNDAKVPFQIYTNRSDIPGGSTLGNISGTQVSVSAVDIGIAQWAMHSPYESGGALDPEYMEKAVSGFYASSRCIS